MPITVTIGATDQTAFIRSGSLSAQQALGSRTTCNFSVRANSELYVPVVGEPVSIDRDAVKLFAGFVWSVNIRRYKGIEYIDADVTCVDNTYITDRRVAGERDWSNVVSGQIVRDIIALDDLASEGVTDTLVTDGPTITSFSLRGFPTITEALEQLAGLAQMRWYIDENKALRWFSDSTLGYTAPFAVTADNIDTITKSDSLEEYANKIIVRIPQSLRASETETFDGATPNYATDGSRKTFFLPFPCGSAPTIATGTGSPATYTDKTVGIQDVDTGKDWYWSQGSNWITQDAGGTALTAAESLAVTYIGISSDVVTADNVTEINNRAAVEGGTGYHSRTYDQSQLLSIADAQAAADALLDTLDELPVVVEYRTTTYLESSADLMRPGMRQAVFVTGIDATSPVGQYVVRSVKFQDEERWPDHIGVVVELISGPLLKDMTGLLKSLGGASSSISGVAAGQMLIVGTPTETPDGSETVFTFDRAPRFVVYNGQLLRSGSTLAISGSTATFTIAPETGADLFSLS